LQEPISGAYFGDKMSPLSDTTNLAPAKQVQIYFTHIKYMAYTTVPTIIITLIVFAILSGTIETKWKYRYSLLTLINNTFYISPIIFSSRELLLQMIVMKTKPLIALQYWCAFGS
jgi:NhaC family Na+:H+ antiporter